MPQLVALFNGFGGGASLLVVAVSLHPSNLTASPSLSLQSSVAAAAAAIVGTVTLTGSLVAFAKLQRLLRRPLVIKGQRTANR
jgi:H+-translocating NAD(P) transhydrogenase subunit beta